MNAFKRFALYLTLFSLVAGALALAPQAGARAFAPQAAPQDAGLFRVPEPDPGLLSPAVSGQGAQTGSESINPLTGLPAQDPSLLALPPAMVSVSNFPVSARPQAGLSYAPYVFEMYIGEGMTRFLALFYGDFPQAAVSSNAQSGLAVDQAVIGPVRSGRLPYQGLRNLYNGFLVMASASQEVRSELSTPTNVYGADPNNINSAMIDVNRLEEIARANANGKSFDLNANVYTDAPPADGQQASRLWMFYSFLNQAMWEYDSASGAYLRSQDLADGSGEFVPSSDRLTGEQLAFENVIVLFVKHTPLNSAKTVIDLDLDYTQNKAYLFRDGQVYPIYWSTLNGAYEAESGLLRPIRFVDKDGEPFPLKPGQTWVELVDLSATLAENQPGAWKARFYAP